MGICCSKDEFKPKNGGMLERKRSFKIRGEIDQDESEDKERSFSSDALEFDKTLKRDRRSTYV